MFAAPMNHEQNQEQNREQEPGTRNPEPGTAQGAWCPMHPSVRGAAGEKCGDCGMALVEIPDATGASFWLDAEADAAAVSEAVEPPSSRSPAAGPDATGAANESQAVKPSRQDVFSRPRHGGAMPR